MPETCFQITWRDAERDETLTVKARKVEDSTLGLSFIRISEFVFEDGSLVVNPQQELLRQRLRHVTSLHLSIHRVLSIAELGPEHAGLTFTHDRSNLVVFPTPK